MDEVTTMRDSNGPPFERIRRLVEAPVFEDGDKTRTARVLRRTALIIVGIGVVGIPLRVFVPPEIALFELRRADESTR